MLYMTHADLAPVFCDELIDQELDDTDAYIDIPEEIQNFYKMYRPATFFRTLHKDKWGRVRIKHAAANHAFDMVRRYLTGLPVEIEENR